MFGLSEGATVTIRADAGTFSLTKPKLNEHIQLFRNLLIIVEYDLCLGSLKCALFFFTFYFMFIDLYIIVMHCV